MYLYGLLSVIIVFYYLLFLAHTMSLGLGQNGLDVLRKLFFGGLSV